MGTDEQELASHKQREFEYEQWRKWLTVFHFDNDLNNDNGSPPEPSNPVSLEQLRGIFSQGYRLAMLQIQQRVKQQQLADNTIHLADDLEKFTNQRIEDSFGLHGIESHGDFKLSKVLKEFHETEVVKRDLLKW
jgi:hypothetical protein